MLKPFPSLELCSYSARHKERECILRAKELLKKIFSVAFLYFFKLFPSHSVSSLLLLYPAAPFVPMTRINYQVNGIFIKWNLRNLCLTVSLFIFPGNFPAIYFLHSSVFAAAYRISSLPIGYSKITISTNYHSLCCTFTL
jgi:hypothetical protein